MRFYKAKIILISSFLVVGFMGAPVQAGDGVLFIAADHTEGYDRALFKLWVDADKNGCDTRAEVLIKEAVVKPKKGANCKLTGGKWVSSYDGVTYTNSSKLDIDHLVPLAEAWRSGAWAWTDKQREEYANYLENERALNAVTASVNRSKGDKDIANWLPKKNVCDYLAGWVTVKANFQLTVDAAEAKIINKYYTTCGLGWITKESVTPAPAPTVSSAPSVTPSSTPKVTLGSATPEWLLKQFLSFPNRVSDTEFNFSSCSKEAFTEPCNPVEPTSINCLQGKQSQAMVSIQERASIADRPNSAYYKFNYCTETVTPGAFCSLAGAIGISTSGVTYSCKTSPTDTRNRWRQ
jgi:hypothetical protein